MIEPLGEFPISLSHRNEMDRKAIELFAVVIWLAQNKMAIVVSRHGDYTH